MGLNYWGLGVGTKVGEGIACSTYLTWWSRDLLTHVETHDEVPDVGRLGPLQVTPSWWNGGGMGDGGRKQLFQQKNQKTKDKKKKEPNEKCSNFGLKFQLFLVFGPVRVGPWVWGCFQQTVPQ